MREEEEVANQSTEKKKLEKIYKYQNSRNIIEYVSKNALKYIDSYRESHRLSIEKHRNLL